MYEYQAQVLHVVDGDTLRLEVDLGLDLRHRIIVRLAGLNTPELATSDGKAARQYVQDWLNGHALIPGVHATENSWEVLVQTHKDRREKYGRYLATVSGLGDPPRCLNDDLLQAGLAVPYDGGKRP